MIVRIDVITSECHSSDKGRLILQSYQIQLDMHVTSHAN